ncbi:MAG: DPP IV N-terminal domain-containing protein [Muribaculaceae bacterium]|nr:DPP IV N-terminal domain-containing protein [Muribaculaceae bacterium]
MKKKALMLAAMGYMAVASASAAAPLKAADYCDLKVCVPAGIGEMRPMADGKTYSMVSKDGRKIDIYSYETGKKTGTLFDLDAVKGQLKIDSFDGYQISDNGRKILLWNDVKGIWRYSFTAEYYVYDIMRATMQRVSSQGAQRGATMSHDGLRVAYVRDNNVFISNLDYNTDIAVTTDGAVNKITNGAPDWVYEEEFGVLCTLCWSGDDQTLAFVKWNETDVPAYSFDDYRSYYAKDPLGDPYPTSFTYKYPLPGYPNSIVSVHAYDLNSRVTKEMQLQLGKDDYVPNIQFDGKGEKLMVMKLNRDQNDLRIFSVNPGSTVATQVYSEQSKAWIDNDVYNMVHYGNDSFVIASDKSGWTHLYEYSYNGSQLRQITKGDFNVTDYYGKSAAGAHFVQTTKLGAVNRNVAMVDAKGVMKLLHDGAGWESCSFSKDFSYYVRRWSDLSTPPQYTLWSTAGKKVAELEMNAAYAARYAGSPKFELTTVKNAVGQDMDAMIMKPADFNASKKYPLMMYQYNGPRSQQVTNKWQLDGLNYIAQSGYVVAVVDGRGTGGRSAEWCHSVYMHLGKYETEDQIAGANEIAMLPYVDASRMSLFGWSYGGYMTLMEMTAENTPFKCGVAMAAVTDWRWYDSIYTERFMRTPAQNEEGYASSSAIGRSQRLKGRLLIMSGSSDDNVHFYNTLKYTSKINFEGKMFDMMVFTGMDHSLRTGNARTQLYSKVVDFLDTNLK